MHFLSCKAFTNFKTFSSKSGTGINGAAFVPSVIEVLSFRNNQIKAQIAVLIERDRNQCWSVLTDGHLLNHSIGSIRFTLCTTDQILKEYNSLPFEPPGLSLKTREKLQEIPLILGAIKDLQSNSPKKEYMQALPLQLRKTRYNIHDLTLEFQKIKSNNYSSSKWATYQTVLQSTNMFRIVNDPLKGMEIECFSNETRDFYLGISEKSKQEEISRFLEKVGAGSNNSWSDFDQKLKNVLKKGVLASRIFPDINKIIALDVLRKTGKYEPNLSDLVVFLKDSGIVAPWETFPGKYTNLKRFSDLFIMEEEVATKEFQEEYSQKLINDLDDPKTKTNDFKEKYSWLTPIFVPSGGINDLPINDGCMDLRMDFQDLPVYIVDGSVAHEIDDGFSIERKPDGIWLHVHIADPTAYLSPNHPLSLFAQMRYSTIYFPDRHLPLIPHKLTNQLFNLGTSSFAITFSAKFQSNGDISDYKVQPSIVRNIKHYTYTNADRILKGTDDQDVFSKDLKDIQKLMDKHLEHRSSQGALSTEFSGELYLDPYPFKDTADSWNPHPAKYPRIQLDFQDDSQARLMVSECMIVAGRVGARFFSENNIPALYRGQAAPNLSQDRMQDFKRMLSKKDPKTAILPTVESRNIVQYLLHATLDTKPSMHFAMGLDKAGYVKLSSPLRRYTDLLLHWNLKAFWSKTKYPFSEQDISSMIPRKTIIDKELKYLCKHIDRYWLFEWIRRRQVLYNNPEVLKENAFVPHEYEFGIPRSWRWTRESDQPLSEYPLYDAFILGIDPDKKYFTLVVPSFFNFTTRCYYRAKSDDIFVGNKIKVRIYSVDPGILDLKLEYVRS